MLAISSFKAFGVKLGFQIWGRMVLYSKWDEGFASHAWKELRQTMRFTFGADVRVDEFQVYTAHVHSFSYRPFNPQITSYKLVLMFGFQLATSLCSVYGFKFGANCSYLQVVGPLVLSVCFPIWATLC